MFVPAITLVLLLGVGPQDPGPHAAPPPPPTSAPADSPEENLWREIVKLQAEPTTTQPYTAWFEAAIRQRQALLERAQLYLRLYPGGTHQVEAVRLELATLYELGSLQGGSFDPLRSRIREYLRDGSTDHPAVWEAAWWDVVCRRIQRRAATTQPSSAPVLGPDDELLAAYRQYVACYPRSPYVPRMAALLFERALETADQARMRQLVAVLREHFPDHAVTASLAAQWQREQAVGHPFWLSTEPPETPQIDTRRFVGRPVLIVVWTSSDAQARRRVRQVEAFRRACPEVRVVGVNLDEDRADMRAACAELGIAWPQFNDGLGPANRFARQWGVRRVPRVFVIDRNSRLFGSAEDESWQRLAEEVAGCQGRAGGVRVPTSHRRGQARRFDSGPPRGYTAQTGSGVPAPSPPGAIGRRERGTCRGHTETE